MRRTSNNPTCRLCGGQLEFFRALAGMLNHWICTGCNQQWSIPITFRARSQPLPMLDLPPKDRR